MRPPWERLSTTALTMGAALLAGCVMIVVGVITSRAGSPDWSIALAWTWASAFLGAAVATAIDLVRQLE